MQALRFPVDRLREVAYFTDLDESILADVVRQVRIREVAPGETVVVEGAPCEGLFFVVRGHVRLFRSGPDGREQVLRVIGPGRTFNDGAVFSDAASAESAAALGPATLGLVPTRTMRQLLDSRPAIARTAIQLLAERARALGQVVEDLALRDVTARVAGLLLGCAGHHGHFVDGAPEACERITHQEIAAMTGSVREVVQRALKELERAGAIKLERARIHILDTAILERFCDAELTR